MRGGFRFVVLVTTWDSFSILFSVNTMTVREQVPFIHSVGVLITACTDGYGKWNDDLTIV